MTKNEALGIQTRCENILSNKLGFRCELCMALNGRLQVRFDSYFINISSELDHIHYISFSGYYDELVDYCEDILSCVEQNRELFEKLIWSYDHHLELSDD